MRRTETSAVSHSLAGRPYFVAVAAVPCGCPMLCPEELEALEPDDALALDEDNIRHWLSGHDRLALPEGGLSRFRLPGAQVQLGGATAELESWSVCSKCGAVPEAAVLTESENTWVRRYEQLPSWCRDSLRSFLAPKAPKLSIAAIEEEDGPVDPQAQDEATYVVQSLANVIRLHREFAQVDFFEAHWLAADIAGASAAAGLLLYKGADDDQTLSDACKERSFEIALPLLPPGKHPASISAIPDKDLTDDFLYDVFVFLDGLELRIRDFEEGCFKLSQVERRLERCLDDVESQLELEAVQQAGLVDEVLAARLVEQRRVIKLQQDELDQLHFEHQVLSEEASRLREEVAALELDEMSEEEEFGVGFSAEVSDALPSDHARSATSPGSPVRGREGHRASGRSHSGSARRPGDQVLPVMIPRGVKRQDLRPTRNENKADQGRQKYGYKALQVIRVGARISFAP
eukprot:s17_g8.t2